MLKKFKAIAATALLAMSFSSFSAEFNAGEEYLVIHTGKPTTTNSVVEYFSIYCPHCYSFEKQVIPDYLEMLPDEIELSRSPVTFLGFIDQASQVQMAKAYWVAENSGKGDEFLHAAFERIHLDKKKYAVPILAKVLGKTENEVKGLIDADVVDDKLTEEVGTHFKMLDAGMKGVPSFVVNGKYLIQAAELDRANFTKSLADITTHLNSLD